MVRGIVDLDSTLVREIMTPRVDVVALPRSPRSPRPGGSRSRGSFPFPGVRRDDRQRRGHPPRPRLAARLGRRLGRRGDRGLVGRRLFVPETRTVAEVLAEMRTRDSRRARGGRVRRIRGMVTLEDLFEEIVGEIRDEHEPGGHDARGRGRGAWLVSGAAHAEELERVFGVDLGERDYDTVAGFVTARAGTRPRARRERFTQGACGRDRGGRSARRVRCVRVPENRSRRPRERQVGTRRDRRLDQRREIDPAEQIGRREARRRRRCPADHAPSHHRCRVPSRPRADRVRGHSGISPSARAHEPRDDRRGGRGADLGGRHALGRRRGEGDRTRRCGGRPHDRGRPGCRAWPF